jgi:hypothetical protein
MTWFSLANATTRLSRTIMADTESTRRTVVFKKEGRVIPVDHIVNARHEKVEKLQVGKDIISDRADPSITAKIER